jgi:hypothetical protein
LLRCMGPQLAVANALKQCDAVLPARDRLPVDDAGARAQPSEALNDEREAVGQVVARPAVELHPIAVLARDDPEAVMLDFVQPRLAGRWVRGGCGEARRDEARRQGTRTTRSSNKGCLAASAHSGLWHIASH